MRKSIQIDFYDVEIALLCKDQIKDYLGNSVEFWEGVVPAQWQLGHYTLSIVCSTACNIDPLIELANTIIKEIHLRDKTIVAALFGYYLSDRLSAIEGLGFDAFNELPGLHHENEVLRYVSNPSIDIKYDGNGKGLAVINFSCEWDPEHGVEIVIDSDLYYLSIGQAGGA